MKAVIVSTAENKVIAVESGWPAAENVIRQYFNDAGLTEDDGEAVFAVDAEEAETRVLRAAIRFLEYKIDNTLACEAKELCGHGLHIKRILAFR